MTEFAIPFSPLSERLMSRYMEVSRVFQSDPNPETALASLKAMVLSGAGALFDTELHAAGHGVGSEGAISISAEGTRGDGERASVSVFIVTDPALAARMKDLFDDASQREGTVRHDEETEVFES